MSSPRDLRGMSGGAAPPRSNGELVFEEPWQARAFGVAVGLVEQQKLDWESFRGRLIDEIGARERGQGGASGDPAAYYERWLAALERLVLETGMVSSEELEVRVREIAAANLHDHGHDH